jgi:hypothetical protein
MALDFEAVAIKLIAEGKTFRITALPVAVKPKGSKLGTRGACKSGGGKKRGGGRGIPAYPVSAAWVQADGLLVCAWGRGFGAVDVDVLPCSKRLWACVVVLCMNASGDYGS